MELLLPAIWLAIVAWLIWRALRQRGALEILESSDRRDGPSVAIIIPARNEEANIGPCLASFLAQTYAPLRAVAVDDHSDDGTAGKLREFAQRDRRLKALRAPDLPRGWTGKSHACWVASRATPSEVEWLCFTDADVRAQPKLIGSALERAIADHLDFLSLAPRQNLLSFAERLVMPCGFYILSFTQNLSRIQSAQTNDATATGQFILVRRAIYDAVGGHGAVSGEICEDLALARLVKAKGGRVRLASGQDLLSARMYDGWRSLWIGVSKNLIDMLGGPASTIVFAASAVLIAWTAAALPAYEAVDCSTQSHSHNCLGFWLVLAGSAAVFAFHIAGARFFRIPLWYGFLFPLGYSAGAAMALDSVRRKASGKIEWKGRTYP